MSIGIFLLKPLDNPNINLKDLKSKVNAFDFVYGYFYDEQDFLWEIVEEYTLNYEINRNCNFKRFGIEQNKIYDKSKFKKQFLNTALTKKHFTHFYYG